MNRTAQIIVGAVFASLLVLTFYTTVEVGAGWSRFILTFGTFVAGWLTLVILSFLYKDNPFYKAAEHIMVGIAMGYFTIYYIFQVIEPRFWNKLVLDHLEEGDLLFGSADVFRWALIIPAILGILMLTRIVPKISWLSRWSIATSIGIGMGLSLPPTIQANITTQVLAATRLPIQYVQALYGVGKMPGFANVPLWEVGVPILMVGTVCVLAYFFFSVPHTGIVGQSARIGIWVLMIGFGASFGYTVMARLSLFIGRVLFVLKDWLDVLPPT
ncbi:MAG: hypothetical protein ACC662_01575 [Planctomycetota bacterium]